MMIDDECSIMNEVINKPPPPPPEGQDKRGQQGNKRDSNSRNQRRKEANNRFQQKNRKNEYDFKPNNFNSHQPPYPGPGPSMPPQQYNQADSQQYMPPSTSHAMPGPQFPGPGGQNVMAPWVNPQPPTPGPMHPPMPGPPMQGPYPHPSMQDQNQMQMHPMHPPMPGPPMQGGPPSMSGQPPIPGQSNMNGPPCPPMPGPQAMPPGMQMPGPSMPGPPGETSPNAMPGMGGGSYPMGMMDPSMMAAWGMLGPDGQPIKAPITYSKCVLYPPNPSAPKPTTRERPPGCRTIFVGGLPENADEEIIRDVFEKCGEIQTIRVSKKNFCHIRYSAEYCVDNAIYLSGWRMRINNEADGPNTGRLHVDFAQARDDHYEWECNVRAHQREERHRQMMSTARARVLEDMMRPPSPPPIPHFSDHEAHTIAEDIKKEETFAKSVEILLTWLERGECSKRNAPGFFTMIQAVNSHVRRLMGEQATHEADLQRIKEDYKAKVQSILSQFGQIETVFTAAGHQKVWDHFTKAQRKNITTWKKQAADIRTLQLSGALNESEDVAMDLSDDEKEDKETENDKEAKKRKIDTEKLREESEEWACQAMGYRNEVESIKADMETEVNNKDKQIKILQQTLQGMQQQLIEAQKRKGDLPAFLKTTEEKKSKQEKPQNQEKQDKDENLNQAEATEDESSKSEPVIVPLVGKHAKIVGIVSSFLNVHPFGASMDYIWSYLLKIDPTLGLSEVENVLQQYPDCFELKLTGVGASMERKWMFVAFQT